MLFFFFSLSLYCNAWLGGSTRIEDGLYSPCRIIGKTAAFMPSSHFFSSSHYKTGWSLLVFAFFPISFSFLIFCCSRGTSSILMIVSTCVNAPDDLLRVLVYVRCLTFPIPAHMQTHVCFSGKYLFHFMISLFIVWAFIQFSIPFHKDMFFFSLWGYIFIFIFICFAFFLLSSCTFDNVLFILFPFFFLLLSRPTFSFTPPMRVLLSVIPFPHLCLAAQCHYK
ncbi:uncharacterized protein TEOVI_000596100 [Trypanosoma equiperdum]|uniref:T. brucei spp.-specific protein n=1 Tax=Trypanosoma equiperdum TaxID=5694 RepID=A0A1G4I4N0_TRYEQ|nr:hypothetical protein, conserved [Trypanosoma equiperdum]